jgi:polyisoprenoid-binding protein YceI
MLRTVVALSLLSPLLASAAEYELDATHSYVGFTIRHMMVVNQRGQFQKVRGLLRYDDRDPARSSIEAAVDLASIDTREPKRDEHLRSPDFFDVARYPTMTFRSTRLERVGERWKVTGDLSLHGVTRPVVLDAGPLSPESKDPYGVVKVGTSATSTINRKDFGLTWNRVLETGGIAVGDDVQIVLELEFNRKK